MRAGWPLALVSLAEKRGANLAVGYCGRNLYFSRYINPISLIYLMEQSYVSPTGMPPAGGPPPKNWLVESILVTIFCCLPFGIVAIINAANVNSRVAVGDYAGALDASKKAGQWVKYSLIGWAVVAVLYVVFIVVMGVGAGMLNAVSGQ